ncbi:MAG TPA: hypothetical protein VIY51_08990 [Xanthobacteraceae bacterium]
MKKSLITSVVFGALLAGNAMAADMPVKAPMLMKAPPPSFSWTGCYIGGGGGYGMWNQETFEETDPGLVAAAPTQTGGGRGWFGTAQVGCDYQLSTPIFGSTIVIGAQGDWDWGRLKGSPNISDENIGVDETNNWTWGAGGRIGYVIAPQVLGYFSGGYTQAHFGQVNFVSDDTGLSTGVALLAHTYHGWYLGSGYEYGFTFLPGLFWKTEYRYSEFSAADLSHIVLATNVTDGVASNSKKFIQTIRSELVWRFNWAH